MHSAREAFGVGHVQDRQPLHPAGVKHRDRPRHHPAPVVPDDYDAPLTQHPDQALHVPRKQVQSVVFDALRLIRKVVTAHVRGYDAEASPRQRGDLEPPRVPELREAVQQHHERPLPRLDVVQPHPREVGVAVGHGRLGGHP